MKNPFDCQYEVRVADVGGGKTECALMGCWTNCREVGHCTAKEDNQMTIFDYLWEDTCNSR